LKPACIDDPRVAKPFLKWAGGKRQLVPELMKTMALFNSKGTYFEPFLGGAALFFAMRATGWTRAAVLSDINAELMMTYRALRDTASVIPALRDHEIKYKQQGERYYYAVRAESLNPAYGYAVAARMIFLNKIGFNGLYRVNKSGEFNVPYGRHENPTICDAENLKACSIALRGVRLESRSFDGSGSDEPKSGDLVYFDPPYWPVSATADFTAYSKEPFGPAEQERLRDLALRLKARGVHVILSNADVEPVRKLYAKGFEMRRVEARRAINRDATKRGNVGELIIW
jgi:DNA adenine methylase